MRIALIRNTTDLASVLSAWESLPVRSPMSSPRWLVPWWNSVMEGGSPGDAPRRSRSLFIAAGWSREGKLVGVAPWYLAASPTGVRCIRHLGDGTVAGDHQSLVCDEPCREAFCDGLAQAVVGPWRDLWDAIELEGADADDERLADFGEQVQKRGKCLVQTVSTTGTWSTRLPESWEAYLGQLSKNHRKRVRQGLRIYRDSGRLEYRVLQTKSEFEPMFAELMRLNRLRREAVGDRATFDDPQVTAFHRAAVAGLLERGQAHLSVLCLDGRPAAAEYLLKDQDRYYAYQSGFDPAAAEHSPGTLSLAMSLRHAIENGAKEFDFLRGDEPYKASWGAVRRPAITLRIRKRSLGGLLGHVTDNAKRWLKQAARGAEGTTQ